jgi:hypothetical protein
LIGIHPGTISMPPYFPPFLRASFCRVFYILKNIWVEIVSSSLLSVSIYYILGIQWNSVKDVTVLDMYSENLTFLAYQKSKTPTVRSTVMNNSLL